MQASATHIMGSDISYRCLGGNQYQIIVTAYRDCSGIAAATSIVVDVVSSCGTTTVTATRDANQSGQEVSQLCPTFLSTCRGGLYPGVQRFTYIATVTLQPGCGNYTFRYGDCCRNTSTNLLDPNPPSLYFGVAATLNNNAVACNNAPVFTSLPVPYFCVGQPVNYSHGSVDGDGDSLVYSLIVPQDDNGVNLNYQGGYSVNNPLPTASGFGFNTQTGQMSFTPTAQGVYVVDVLVSEYRNGVLIGTTMRDIQIVVINCNNNIPQIKSCLTPSNTTGANINDCTKLNLCPGNTVSFTVGARDPDGQPLTVSSNVATAIPGATVTSTPAGSPDTVNITFSWSPQPTDTGFRYFTIQVQDNACPIPGVQLITYTITVLPETYGGPDKFYCTTGNPVELTAIGGTQFSWTPTTGIVGATPDSSKVLAAPSTTTSYIVTSNLIGGCKTRDTVTVFIVPSINPTITSPNDTICLNSSTSLTASATPFNEGPFTYSWAPVSGGIQSPLTATTDVRPTATTDYEVTIVSQAGCVVKDTFRVVIQGVGPKLFVTPSNNPVCPGTTVTLNPTVSATVCGAVNDPQNPCLPNSTVINKDLGTGTTTATTNTTPYTGTMDGRFQYLYQGYELQALGMGAGAITSMGFNVSVKNSVRPFGKFTIKMACTSLTQLVTGQYVSAAFVTVLNPMTYSTTAGWNIHNFDVPYNWDGFSNLLVEICYDTSSTASADPVFYTQSPELNSVRYGTASLSTASGCTNITTQGSVGRNRPNTRFGMCVAPTNTFTYTWTGSDGSVLAPVSNPTTVVNYNVTYNVRVSDGQCVGDTTVRLFIDTSLMMTAGPDTVVCNGDSIELRARFINPPPVTCIPGYITEQIQYNSISPPGSTTAGPAGDDIVSTVRTLPFTFSFFCNNVTQYYISTNGFITFSSGQGAGCCLGQALPSVASPNNVIAMCWSDLNTNLGGTIDHFTTGTAPNRVVVIRWNNVRFVTGVGAVTGEIHIYEGSNVVEVHILSQNSSGMTNTLGLENTTGTVGASPNGYNASSWTAASPIAFRFTPQSTANSLVSSIVWMPSTGLSNPNILNPKASPAVPTSYSFTAVLNNGCVMRDTINVAISDFPYTLSVAPDSTCPGDTSRITFNGAGVSYRWIPNVGISSDTAQNPLVFPNSSTTYRLTAFNALGCRVTDTLRVNIIQRNVTLGPDTGICPYDSVRLLPSGAPYLSYNWNTGDTVSSISTAPQTTNVKDYWVRVFDGRCFYNSDTVTVSKHVLSPAVVRPAGDTTFCEGSSIVLTASSGFAVYNWNNGGTTQNINVNTTGTYTYTATDSRGCVVKAQDSTRVTSTPSPNPQITANPNAICVGQGTSVLKVNTEQGVTYTWTPGNVTGDSLVISVPGDYVVAASNGGCTARDTVNIIANNPPVVNLGDDINLCSCDTSLTLLANVGGTYFWSDSTTGQSLTVRQSGIYSLTVNDQFNCTGTDAVEIGIRCLTADAIVADPSSGTVFSGRDATLDVTVTGYEGDFNYLWTPSTYLDDSTAKSPYVKSPLITTTYVVLVTDAEFGCTASDTVLLTVVPPGVPPMPDAFSPNGDGMNDTYGPVIPQHLQEIYTIVNLRIYNRWGQLVYDDNGYWDGTFKGAEQPVGTYVYYITMFGPDQQNPAVNVQHHDSGSFTLLR